MSSFQETRTTWTSGSVFAEGIEKVETTKFELELMKKIDCFFDCHGNYDSKLVTFRMKTFLKTKFFPTVSKSIQRIQNDTQNEFPKQKFQVMSEFKTKILQPVRF